MCIDKMRYIMIGCALALIALAGCKTPELSMDERISLPESGEMGRNDTTFVKPLSWDVFFQDTLLRGYVDVALRNNHSFQQSMERIAMSRAALQRAKELLLPDVNLNIGASVNRFGEYTMDGVGNSETNVPSLPKDKHIPDPYRDFGLSLSFQWEADIWGKLTRKKQAAAAPVAAAPAAPAAPKAVAPGSAGELKLHDVEPKTAAMIMAIVADKLGKPLNELRFKSIKEVK